MSLGILYDGQIYSYIRTGGIPRYFAELIARLPPDVRPALLLNNTASHGLPQHPNLDIFGETGGGPAFVARRRSARRLRRTEYAIDFDVAHPTYYSLVTERALRDYDCPVVLTVHDMIHERYSDELDPRGILARQKRDAVLAADRVICVSENTRRDVAECYSIDPAQLTVVPQAAGLHPTPAANGAAVPLRPYFIYVGSRSHAYKNFWGAATAMREVRARYPDTMLAIVGASLDRTERERLATLGLGDAVAEFADADDGLLAALYRGAIALVYPSLYEGFGIPPLEAMRCGTAVVAGDVASLPEVVGDAGLLVDPAAPDALAGAMLRLLDNPSEREQLVIRGADRAARFSWDRTAAATLDVYHSML